MNKTGVGDVQVGAQNIFCFSIPKQTQKDGIITLVVTTHQIRSIQSNSFSFIERKRENG